MEKKYTYTWLALAVIFLGIGGAFALLVGLSRTPFGYKYLPADFLYQGIVGHVILAIVLWLLSFTVVLWSRYFKGPQLKISYLFSLFGALFIIVSVFTGGGKAVPNNYIPTIDDPVFFVGIGLFFIGIAINAFGYLKDALKSLRSSDPLRATLAVSVVLAVIMLISLIVSLLMHRAEAAPLLFFERLFWIPGHIQQVLNGALLIAVWYALRKALGLEIEAPAGMGFFNGMLVAGAVLLFAIPFFLDPVERTSKIISELVYAVGLGVPIFAHAVKILRGLRKRSGGGAVYLSLVFSMGIYFLGIAIAYSGLGDDLRVPAHYHGAVTGLTLAMMGLTYNMLKTKINAGSLIKKLAGLQPALYGTGMILFILGLMVSGLLGAPRKTYGVEFARDPLVLSALTVMGVGTLLAVLGGVVFVFYSSVLLIRRRDGASCG
ncbi:MAG: cbb3-type cytochrome c oxidase subunit I [Thermodesulfobacteriota bacterium]